MSKYMVKRIEILDQKDDKTPVVRYALIDDSGFVYLKGRGFGFLVYMTSTDHSTMDCRHLLRSTTNDALADLPDGGEIVDADNKAEVADYERSVSLQAMDMIRGDLDHINALMPSADVLGGGSRLRRHESTLVQSLSGLFRSIRGNP